MSRYYRNKLAAARLERCYDLAPERIGRYLQAELDYAISSLGGRETILELGCGYGRLIRPLARMANLVVGIDSSLESLLYARTFLTGVDNYALACMDASCLGFRNGSLDRVLCLQNGLSAFRTDPELIVSEALRVTRSGGRCLFTSYSPKFWGDRLRWFELQAEAGLVGEIDYARTGNGEIVCKDGFTATTISENQFTLISNELGLAAQVADVDECFVACEFIKE
jgi:2-polyprenyl-6-hydroxyphenyl methylase/3-demethylubiquinone-9 3-methyltransferase